ncbi:NADH-ubiquinone oxidoreductase Complex1 subunit [Trametes meyenii]|nr:NADH-ubiquinone oxidoreductase Complex1 subunit [Trametes meyenii]
MSFNIPARLARSARISGSPDDARKRVIQLYRDWYRSAPEICSLYALNVTPAYVRHCIRNHFEENRYVTDTRVVDVLIQKGRQEYQETLNCWKQLDHIMGILLAPRGRPQRTFLQKFYEGRDEDAVLPAATGIVHPKAV